jgi:hypothetical protein
MYIPEKGDIVKMHSWHGVVLDVFTNDRGSVILKVQTARNVFRKLPPELIELDAAPGQISLASQAELVAEIERHRQVQQSALAAMLKEIRPALAIATT